MGSTRTVTTPYEMFVKTNVPQAVRVGQGAYNYKELGELVGLKPTANFRRRINELVRDGVLRLVPAFTPRGGIENRFTVDLLEGMDLPF